MLLDWHGVVAVARARAQGHACDFAQLCAANDGLMSLISQ